MLRSGAKATRPGAAWCPLRAHRPPARPGGLGGTRDGGGSRPVIPTGCRRRRGPPSHWNRAGETGSVPRMAPRHLQQLVALGAFSMPVLHVATAEYFTEIVALCAYIYLHACWGCADGQWRL